MIISNGYVIGAIVYHVTSPEVKGVVTGIMVRISGWTYAVTWGSSLDEKWHYEFELTDEKSFDTSSGVPA